MIHVHDYALVGVAENEVDIKINITRWDYIFYIIYKLSLYFLDLEMMGKITEPGEDYVINVLCGWFVDWLWKNIKVFFHEPVVHKQSFCVNLTFWIRQISSFNNKEQKLKIYLWPRCIALTFSNLLSYYPYETGSSLSVVCVKRVNLLWSTAVKVFYKYNNWFPYWYEVFS